MVRQASVEIQKLIQPLVEGLGYEFVGAEYLAQGKNSLLRIYIDTPEGVTVDDCERVSRQVSSMLDVEDPIPGHYSLEVSSPGLDRPLFKLEQFEAFVGEVIKIKLLPSIAGRKKFTGVLRAIEGEIVTLEVDGETVEIAFGDIDQARLEPEF